MLEKEQAYFEAHKDELRQKYAGKRVVISGAEVKGVYNTDGDAFAAATKTMKPGDFMIKLVTHTEEESIRRYMNRVYV
ncbi:MAG: hypothetical protein LBL00_00035 [Endomicrobium sp.]|jgi:hypothetical protein|nr:hypothetical protein [Endomicrobium sp.]